MKITLLDRSNYFRGLLLLISRDRKVTGPEIVLMERIGKTLGFEREFCKAAIRDILHNKHIAESPPRFSTKSLAKKFVRDGLTLAAADLETHASEEQWLRSVSAMNGLPALWFLKEKLRKTHTKSGRLEVDDLEYA